MRLKYLLLICCLMLTACGNGTTSNSSNVHGNGYKPTLNVKMDINGNQLTATVETDMIISSEHSGMARVSGEGHVHMYLDDGPKMVVKEDQKVFTDLPPGKHVLKVSLHNNDHTPYDVTKTYDFDIK
jgi:hypothetical protein